jgi:PAS domain S-box-containing protein
MRDLNCPPDQELERLVAEQTAELEAIISATANGLVLFDSQGRIVRMNPVAERMLGYNPQNYEPDLARRLAKLHFRWGDGREMTDPSDLPMPRALRGETVRNVLVCFEHPETRRDSWATVSAAPIRDGNHRITGVVVTFTDVTEIRQAQERAEDARERLTNVLDSLLEGYIVLSREWQILEINQKAAGLFGRTAAELTGRNMWEEFPAARRTHFYDNYEQAFQENQPTHFEGLSAITGRWHEVHGYPRGDRIEIYFHDITDRKLLQAETHRQREFYDALLQAAPAGICVLDGGELRVKYANAAYLQFLEEPFQTDGVTGRSLEEFVPLAREHGLVDLFHHVAETGEPYTNPEYRHEGFRRGATYWRYSLLPFYFGQASPQDALAFERDLMIVAIEVTEQVQNRRKLEELLRKAEEQAATLQAQAVELTAASSALEVERTRLSTVIENMPVAVMLAEAPSGRLVLSNRRVEEIWRHTFVPLNGMADYRQYRGFHPDGRPYEPEEWPLARSLATGETVHGEEIEFLRGDETRGVLSASSAPIRGRDGGIVAAVVSFVDITDRKEAERQAQTLAVLEERQRLARDLHDSVSQALFGVALATHNALTNWEKKPPVARERVRNANQLAKTAQAEMRALIFELRPDQLATDGLVKAIELQTNALIERRAFDVEVDLCEEPDVPLPVKEAFYRIAQEALNNAVKHAKATRLNIRLAHAGSRLDLEVRDNGRGFDPAAFYPGHFGLRSMQERAERIGVTLSITSEPETGSQVSLTYQSTDATAREAGAL